jgi:hypothetical protein
VTYDPLTPPFASKIAVVVRDDLEPWQCLNVSAFLISAVTAAHPELVGAGRLNPRHVSTGHDADNRAAVRAVVGAELDLVGLGSHGPKNAVDKVIKGTRPHR